MGPGECHFLLIITSQPDGDDDDNVLLKDLIVLITLSVATAVKENNSRERSQEDFGRILIKGTFNSEVIIFLLPTLSSVFLKFIFLLEHSSMFTTDQRVFDLFSAKKMKLSFKLSIF